MVDGRVQIVSDYVNTSKKKMLMMKQDKKRKKQNQERVSVGSGVEWSGVEWNGQVKSLDDGDGRGEKSLRRPGIEPGPPAWQASILPLNHRRDMLTK